MASSSRRRSPPEFEGSRPNERKGGDAKEKKKNEHFFWFYYVLYPAFAHSERFINSRGRARTSYFEYFDGHSEMAARQEAAASRSRAQPITPGDKNGCARMCEPAREQGRCAVRAPRVDAFPLLPESFLSPFSVSFLECSKAQARPCSLSPGRGMMRGREKVILLILRFGCCRFHINNNKNNGNKIRLSSSVY